MVVVQDDNSSTMPPSDVEIDSASYGYGSKDRSISYKDIVLRAIEKCRVEGSKEMSRGGQKLIFSKELNDWIPINLPDQRQLYKQTILQLYDLLIFTFDKEGE